MFAGVVFSTSLRILLSHVCKNRVSLFFLFFFFFYFFFLLLDGYYFGWVLFNNYSPKAKWIFGISIISELNKEFPAIWLVERFVLFNNYSPKAKWIFTNIHEPEGNNCFSIITQVIIEIPIKQRNVKFYHNLPLLIKLGLHCDISISISINISISKVCVNREWHKHKHKHKKKESFPFSYAYVYAYVTFTTV